MTRWQEADLKIKPKGPANVWIGSGLPVTHTETPMPPVKPPRIQNPKFVVRLPDDLRDQIKEVAYRNRRSMNSELILAVEAHLRAEAIKKAFGGV